MPVRVGRVSVARAVVMISTAAPPQGNAGAARLEGFARYLPEFGWRPVVVTSTFGGRGAVAEAPTVRRAEPLSLFESRLNGGASESGLRAPLRPLAGHFARRFAIPDLHAGWIPGAVLAARRVAVAHNASAIFSSSPSESSHVVGLAASSMTGLPWVVELRDGWLFEGLRPLEAHPLRRRLEANLERRVVTRAAAVVGVTRPIASDLRDRFGSATWIPNGFDPEPPPDWALAEAREMLDPGSFNVVYTGSFRLSRYNRSPAVLADAFERLTGESANGRPIALTVVGRLEPSERSRLASVRGVRIFDPRPREVAIALQRLAGALVLVTMPGESSIATGKLFEYLGAGRPIIALADGNEASALIGELGAGVCVDPTDPHAVACALLQAARGEVRAVDPGDERMAPFRRRAIAERLAAVLDAAVSGDRRALTPAEASASR